MNILLLDGYDWMMFTAAGFVPVCGCFRQQN